MGKSRQRKRSRQSAPVSQQTPAPQQVSLLRRILASAWGRFLASLTLLVTVIGTLPVYDLYRQTVPQVEIKQLSGSHLLPFVVRNTSWFFAMRNAQFVCIKSAVFGNPDGSHGVVGTIAGEGAKRFIGQPQMTIEP